MEDRHNTEVIELKKSQLNQVKEDEGLLVVDGDVQERQMLVNLVKVKDEEIKQLKRQLGVVELDQGHLEMQRTSVSPLR